MTDAKALSKIAAEVEKLAAAHDATKAEEGRARGITTAALNALLNKQKEFDHAVASFKDSASDSFNNRWGPKFARAKNAEVSS